MMDYTDRYIRFDWAVKRLLRNKANFGVLEGFLTVLLNEPIRIVEILESEGNQQRENEKFNRVDIKARNSKDEIIIVEVQNTREIYYLERILFGVAKAITEHIELGELYSEVKKVYSVSILYFDIGRGNDYLYHGQNTFVGVHTGDFLEVTTKEKNAIIRKLPAEIFPEYFLIRVNEFNKVAVTPLEEWIEYLKTGIIRPDTKAPGLEEARRKLIYYNMDKKERLAYDEHINAVMIQNDVLSTAALEGRQEGLAEGRQEGLAEGRQEGLAEGRQEGLAEGRQEGLEKGRIEEKRENARKMKSLNLPPETIHQITGLPIEEIEKLS
ncbi:Rpn family recombination-promoting nuclease/putative transposase [Bacteroides fragilis]|uniref:Rpn family recombination-promoting nuclease/putative transposase n=1 Tax=Bacteroides fragilis TaxID=817 RepID=UPI00202FC808|nr:Rpn family recombination-promoting nuclease/putative transposase [Bacteroides fragilis]